MGLRQTLFPEEQGAFIRCVYAAGVVKARMTWAELTAHERAEARQIAASQRCTIVDAAAIVRRSRR